MQEAHEQLDWLVNAVLASQKYRGVSRELIRRIGMQELAKRRNKKESLKATRNKLHQVGGAYLDGKNAYDAWLTSLQQTSASGKRDDLLQTCKQIMSHHASSRERLPILDNFYTTILADLAPVHSVLDLACGLNPLAIPWMPLAEQAHYYACDIYSPMMTFLAAWMALLPIQGEAQVCDILSSCPTQPVDVAFLLKTIPCLEQLDRAAGARLLHSLNASTLVVSFPIQSLGGRHKGMAAHYAAHFRALVAHEPWSVQRFEFPTELVFVVRKG